jgi:serine/threonine-protein kinase
VADEVRRASGDFEVGDQVAGYVLREQIGGGGVAAVYRALDVRVGQWVALKILTAWMGSDSSLRQRFIVESRAAAAIGHPNIIPVLEAGESDGVPFIAMRYVGGGDARILLRQQGPLGAARVTGIIAQVASALDASHAAGLVHGDVRPANILLAPMAGSGDPDHVYLAGFGLGGQIPSPAGLTAAGQFAGPIDNVASERLDGLPADGRADLRALACTAYELLAGEPPVRREEDHSGPPGARLAEAPTSLTASRPDLPSAVDEVLAQAMAGSPSDRYQSCQDFAASLLRACGLEWGASEQQSAGSPDVAPQPAAPLAVDPTGAQDSAESPFAIPLLGAEPGRSLARRPALAMSPAGAVRPADRARPMSARTGLPILGLAGHGPDTIGPVRPGPYAPAPTRRSPVIAAAAGVIILGITIVVFLGLHGGRASPSGQHASPPLPAGAATPGSAGNPSSQGKGGQSGGRAGAGKTGSPGHGPPSRQGNRGKRSRQEASGGPVATVKAYIAAINGHQYGRAWNLGGRNNSASYANFAQGFGTTARDTLIILSVQGDVVTAELVAQQTDGTVKTYQGMYTVDDGVITRSDVRQIS